MTAESTRAPRRILRSIRARNAFGEETPAETESRNRDSLLGPLIVHDLKSRGEDDDRDAEWTVDGAVSVALANVVEADFDSLSALCLSTQVLAHGGQFGRLRALAPRYADFASRLSGSSPYLSLVLDAFSNLLAGREPDAVGVLTLGLGVGDQGSRPPTMVERHPANILQVLLSVAVRNWLINGDLDLFEDARNVSIRQGDGLGLSVVDAITSFITAATDSSTQRVVTNEEPLFQRNDLTAYLAARGIKTLFPPQRLAIENGLLSEGNHLISMPTSSGKTFLAELRIIADTVRHNHGRAIFLAPYRLLARQVESELREGLRRARLSVRDLGGEFDASIEDELAYGEIPDVAVMTPERFDALIRLADDDRDGSEIAAELLSSLALLVFDEIQLVGRPGRGPRFELLLSRLRRRLPHVSLLGLSAASRGVDTLAEWLDAKPSVMTRGRPTGTIELSWRTDGALLQRFDGSAYKISSIRRAKTAIESAAGLALSVRNNRQPVLIVETTRANAESIIRKVRDLSRSAGTDWRASLTKPALQFLDSVAEEAEAVLGAQNDIGSLIRQGLAYHHAGIPPHLLRLIEDLVKAKSIRVMAATTTVAEGAHLPFQVVILPHLNFQGPSRRLEQDLYQNIVGRVGRANVAMEGIVVTLGSDSRSLRGHVEGVLWNSNSNLEVRGRLEEVLQSPRNISDFQTMREVRSQILAWVGDEGNYVEDQAETLASSTLSWRQTGQNRRRQLEQFVNQELEQLEQQGLALAASPYRLTALGRSVRLAGIGPRGCIRIVNRIGGAPRAALIEAFDGVSEISDTIARAITELVFETEEVLEKSLWIRRRHGDEESQLSAMEAVFGGTMEFPYRDPVLQVELSMFAGWIRGVDLISLGTSVPQFPGRGAFTSDDIGKRTSDVSEYISRISYPAAWAWGGVVALLGQDGTRLPAWIRRAIELGVPSETAVGLAKSTGMSRDGCCKLARNLSPEWTTARVRISDLTEEDLAELGLTSFDRDAATRVIRFGGILGEA